MFQQRSIKLQVTYKGNTIRIMADCPIETLKARRAWNDAFQMLEDSNCKSRYDTQKTLS